MKIGTLSAGDTERVLDLLDGWGLADGWTGRDFFRRYVELDPTYESENFWVAREGDTLLSCVQIFPRRIRMLGHMVPAGGIGSVFTRRERRGEGLAGSLLEAAAEAMRRRGMELSLLFTGRFSFYERYGWSCWKGQRALLRRTPGPPGTARSRAVGSAGAGAGDASAAQPAGLEIAPFEPARDLSEVRALHEHYSHGRHGTVIRDEALWRASLLLGGNPDEEFTVARRNRAVVAYLRTTRLLEREVVTELARADGEPEALAALVDAALPSAEDAPRAPDTGSADLLLPAFDDLEFTLALEQRGITSKPLEDPMNMLRCLDGPALSRRLGAPMYAGESDAEFLTRMLPVDQFAFWPADRF